MPFELQFRRYPTAQIQNIVGRDGELIIEEINEQRQLRIFDGITPGGKPIITMAQHISTANGETLDQILENLAPLQHTHTADQIIYSGDDTVADKIAEIDSESAIYAKIEDVIFRNVNNQSITAPLTNVPFSLSIASTASQGSLSLGPQDGFGEWDGTSTMPIASRLWLSLAGIPNNNNPNRYGIITEGHTALKVIIQQGGITYSAIEAELNTETSKVDVSIASLTTETLTVDDVEITGEVVENNTFTASLVAKEWLKVKINNNETRYIRLFEETPE